MSSNAQNVQLHQSLTYTAATYLLEYDTNHQEADLHRPVLVLAGAALFVVGCIETVARLMICAVAKLAHFCCPKDSEIGEYIGANILAPSAAHLVLTAAGTAIGVAGLLSILPESVMNAGAEFINGTAESECMQSTARATRSLVLAAAFFHFNGFEAEYYA